MSAHDHASHSGDSHGGHVVGRGPDPNHLGDDHDHDHDDDALQPDEPRTPAWLTLVGAMLFVSAIVLFLATRPERKTTGELTEEATGANAAASVAAAPSAAPPDAARPQAPRMPPPGGNPTPAQPPGMAAPGTAPAAGAMAARPPRPDVRPAVRPPSAAGVRVEPLNPGGPGAAASMLPPGTPAPPPPAAPAKPTVRVAPAPP